MLKRQSVQKFIFLIIILTSVTGCHKNGRFVQKEKNKELEAIEDTIRKCNGFSQFCNKKLNEITILMTHNSYNTKQNKFLFPNQHYSVYRQLSDGVRGLMLDVYGSSKGPVLYHGYAVLGKNSLVSVLDEIKRFLKGNPNEVVTIIFENYATHEAILNAFQSAGLKEMVFIYEGTWPTLGEMLEQNKKLVLFVENNKGELKEGLLSAWEHIFDTRYSFLDVASMDSRTNRGGGGLKTFFLLNHWVTNKLGLPVKSKAAIANDKNVLSDRVQKSYKEHHRTINFLGVDFYHTGDAMAIVDSLNGVVR